MMIYNQIKEITKISNIEVKTALDKMKKNIQHLDQMVNAYIPGLQ